MFDVSGINGSGATGATSGEGKRRDELGQEDFLELMTTQLRNQDPLKPMESGDFMAQIAQFTSAAGIQDLQSAFGDFSESMQATQSLQAAGLVGRQVLVDAGSGYLPQEGALEGSVSVPSSVDNLTVTITDTAGQTVRQLDLGGRPAGSAAFQWDGRNAAGERLPAGTYSVQASTRLGGEAVGLDTRMAATVESVSLSRDGRSPQLELEGLGSMSLADVRQVK